MPEKQETGLGMGAVSPSKNKYEREGGGTHPMPGSGRLEGKGSGGIAKPHPRDAVTVQCSTSCPARPTTAIYLRFLSLQANPNQL